jgi:hypothetical protein
MLGFQGLTSSCSSHDHHYWAWIDARIARVVGDFANACSDPHRSTTTTLLVSTSAVGDHRHRP